MPSGAWSRKAAQCLSVLCLATALATLHGHPAPGASVADAPTPPLLPAPACADAAPVVRGREEAAVLRVAAVEAPAAPASPDAFARAETRDRPTGRPAAASDACPPHRVPQPEPAACADSPALRLMATYESVSIWLDDPAPGEAQVFYRGEGDAFWSGALPLWFDAERGLHKGSLVHLRSGRRYEVRIATGSATYCGDIATKSDVYPVGRTVDLGSRAGEVEITAGGTPDGYLIVEGDVIRGGVYGIHVNAPYVVLRGMKITGAQMNAILLGPRASHVVIERNEITDWGSASEWGSEKGNGRPNNEQGGIHAAHPVNNITIQHNDIHTPHVSSNTWAEDSHKCATPPSRRCHPYGPQAIHLKGDTADQHSNVIRFNAMYSRDPNILFNDVIGGGAHYGEYGFPGYNSDVYHNYASNFADDGLEIEGGGENVRVWGNVVFGFQPETRPMAAYSALAVSAVTRGPLYVWRNVLTRSEPKAYAVKAKGAEEGHDGAVFFFHNTIVNWELGYSSLGVGLNNVVTRNNIFETSRGSIDDRTAGTGNSFDFDLHSGSSPGQPNGIAGKAAFVGSDHDLRADSPGVDAGTRLPGFNDCFAGAAPDMGAREARPD
jgi:hypothetical protein